MKTKTKKEKLKRVLVITLCVLSLSITCVSFLDSFSIIIFLFVFRPSKNQAAKKKISFAFRKKICENCEYSRKKGEEEVKKMISYFFILHPYQKTHYIITLRYFSFFFHSFFQKKNFFHIDVYISVHYRNISVLWFFALFFLISWFCVRWSANLLFFVPLFSFFPPLHINLIFIALVFGVVWFCFSSLYILFRPISIQPFGYTMMK